MANSSTSDLLGRVHLLQKVSVFQALTSKELSDIAKRLTLVQVPAQVTLIHEGEPGDCMYIVASGHAGVYREGRKLGDLRGGDCFGEMALFGEGVRTASIVAEEELQLWQLHSSTFYDILFNHTSIAFEMMKLLSRRLRALLEQGSRAAATAPSALTEAAAGTAIATETVRQESLDDSYSASNLSLETILRRILTLQNIELFAHLTQDDFIWLAQSLEEVEFSAGQMICRTGDFGDTMYAIISGQVQVHRGTQEIALLQEGEYFGEMAVIDSGPRSADCTAANDVVALALHRDLVLAFCFQNMNVLKSILRVLADRLKVL